MYLDDHFIQHSDVRPYYTKTSYENADNCINVLLKHKSISDGISIILGYAILKVNKTVVTGNMASRQKSYSEVNENPMFSVDISDPQSLEKIRLWLRQQEAIKRHALPTWIPL